MFSIVQEVPVSVVKIDRSRETDKHQWYPDWKGRSKAVFSQLIKCFSRKFDVIYKKPIRI